MSNVSEFTEEKITRLQSELFKLKQAECPVKHYFGPGVYIREIVLPKGAAVIGHYHKTEHLNSLVQGKMIIINTDGSKTELTAPKTFVSKPGRKVAYILETVVFQNIHATNETDIEKLEEILLEKNTELEEFKNSQSLLLNYNNIDDKQDYLNALAEFNISDEEARRLSEDLTDQIPFPYGEYKVIVSNSGIEGKGLFATGYIEEYEIIAPALIKNKRTPAGRFTNHSKNPNAIMVLNKNKDIDLVALKPITGMHGGLLGEEITIDYRQALRLKKEF